MQRTCLCAEVGWEDPPRREPAPSSGRAAGVAGGAFYRVLSSPCLGGVGGRGSDLRKFLEGMTPMLLGGGEEGSENGTRGELREG